MKKKFRKTYIGKIEVPKYKQYDQNVIGEMNFRPISIFSYGVTIFELKFE